MPPKVCHSLLSTTENANFGRRKTRMPPPWPSSCPSLSRPLQILPLPPYITQERPLNFPAASAFVSKHRPIRSRRISLGCSKASLLSSPGTSYIEPGSPWQNGYVESFHSRLRDECLACELFFSLGEAKAVIECWRQTYNHRRPHSGLGGLTPAEFASHWAASASVATLPSRRQPNAEPITQPVLS